MKGHQATLYRAAVLHFISDPSVDGEKAYEYFEDGALLVDQGKVVQVGEASHLVSSVGDDVAIVEYPQHLIIPGMIDTHIHYPQVEIMASYGNQLLDWLENYTYPAEREFNNPQHAQAIASFFMDELLKSGTTSALVFGTVHRTSVDAFFDESAKRNTRMICGKVMMDRNAPDFLMDTPQSSYDDSKALIERWHNQGRQHYAVTPRFAVSSSEAQLTLAGKLCEEYGDVYMQTHISESQAEIALVQSLYPNSKDYLEVYEQFGLLGKRSVFAHGIYLKPREREALCKSTSSVAFCPTSNLFLGSGLLELIELEKAGVQYSVATDIGGGTSFSMLQTLNEAYKVCRLNNYSLCPLKSLYMATLGNAKTLALEDKIGAFNQGSEADFVVLDYNCTPLMSLRQSKCHSLSERIFALIMLGDDRAVRATYVAGKLAHERG